MSTTALPTPPHQAHRRYREACQRVHHEEAPLVAEGSKFPAWVVCGGIVAGVLLIGGKIVSVVMGVML